MDHVGLAEQLSPDITSLLDTLASDDSHSDLPYAYSQPPPSFQIQLTNAHKHIVHFERELERNESVVTSAIRETFEAQEQVKSLSAKLAVIEEAKDNHRELLGRATEDWEYVAERDNGIFKRRLEATEMERDEARCLISELRRLIDETSR
jgi:chromosome segregation ATPase